jgi:hypothetical protein
VQCLLLSVEVLLVEKPWSHVSADFYGPTGEYLLVLMDDYSRFPIVEITTSI